MSQMKDMVSQVSETFLKTRFGVPEGSSPERVNLAIFHGMIRATVTMCLRMGFKWQDLHDAVTRETEITDAAMSRLPLSLQEEVKKGN
jgi:hypothetical protein